MTTAIALLALLRHQERPGTLPPSMELLDRTQVLGYTDGYCFLPFLGGLSVTTIDGDVGYAHTSDSGLTVNLRTSELSDVGAADILDLQRVCPSGVFIRCYRSELAKAGKHSPGLPVGWVHNYDVILKLPTDTEKWQPFTLTYPNKAQETISPQIGADGQPTGKGISGSNQTYRITLAPGPKVNTYEWVRIDWSNSNTHWIFTPHASGPMVLRGIGIDLPAQQGEIRLGYGPDRTLANITYPKGDMTLLTFDYKNDLLATATSRTGVTVGYTYATLGDDVVLWKVSDPFKAGETPTDSYVYSYANGMPYPALSQIAVTAGGKWQKSTIEYAGGRLSAVQAATGVRQEIGPPQN